MCFMIKRWYINVFAFTIACLKLDSRRYFFTNMIVLMAFTLFYIHDAGSVIVNTTSGPVMGKIINDDLFGVKYKAFEGIPYAEPPLGDLRFRPPLPIKPWKEVLNATSVGFACPQLNYFQLTEKITENCLFLNIFTPINDLLNESLPVIIFVHGGNFRFGSSNPNMIYGPQLILKRSIIVAMMNYRLGSLGFLSLQNEDALGNAGVKDVLLAVKWINENIERFDGDPNKITIAGQSAGGAIIQCLMLSDKANGLFQRAILLSGSILSPKFIQIDPKNNAKVLGRELGLTWLNESSLLYQLKNVDSSAILQAELNILRRDPRRGIRVYTPFSVCIETESSTAIITEKPITSIRSGKIRNIPIIIGFVNQEGLEVFPTLMAEPYVINRINDNFELCIPSDIRYPVESDMREKLASSIREYYFDNQNISSNLLNYSNLLADIDFTYSIDYLVQFLQERNQSAPIFYYYFTFDGMLNSYKIFANITYPGAAHGDDIGYIFVTSNLIKVFENIDTKTKNVVDIFQTSIVNFAKYGDPTPQNRSNDFFWPEAGKRRNHLIINDNPTVVWHEPIPERMKFWRSTYEKYKNSSK